MPASPIRKLVPYADAAKKRGTKVYHLNIGQPDLETPKAFWDKLAHMDMKVLAYCPSDGFASYREKFSQYYNRLGIHPGDHIGWHYDTSYYRGRRYTLLIGVIDESSCQLDYELHTRSHGRDVVPGSLKIPPGGVVFFNGDELRHRITPLGAGERRVSLTFEYVTDPLMHVGWRIVSNMKDAIAYFGIRQLFRRS